MQVYWYLFLCCESMYVLRVVIVSIVVLYLCCVVAAYYFQTAIIFSPETLPQEFQFQIRAQDKEVFLKTPDGETINGLLYKGSRPEVILYFHGNAGDLSGWQYVGQELVKIGYTVFIIDYRGYGKSTGFISEEGFYTDAVTAYEYLTKTFEPGRILLYGRSIGSGVAVELATKRKVKGIILESPYSSLTRLAIEKAPFLFPSLILKTKFDSETKLDSLTVPLLMMHGTADDLIPPAHSERLYNRYKGKKERILIKGAGHNDLSAFPDYEKVMRETVPHFFE
jgi:uncharacterized protein